MPRRDTGLTLIELLTVMAIAAIGVAMGWPALSDAWARTRAHATMHLLGTDLAMARNTALVRRVPVMACPLRNGQCTPQSRWEEGWVVFIDPDGNRRIDDDSQVLRVTLPPAGSSGLLRLHATRNALRYQANGRSPGTNLSVRVCVGDALLGSVVISNPGRVRSERSPPGTPCPAS